MFTYALEYTHECILTTVYYFSGSHVHRNLPDILRNLTETVWPNTPAHKI